MTADLLAFLSQDDFGCLDFGDVVSLDTAQRQAVVGSMDQILDYYFRAIGYEHIVGPKDVSFRRDLWAWSYSRLTKDTPDNAYLDFLLDTNAALVEYFGVLLSECMSPIQDVHRNHFSWSSLSI